VANEIAQVLATVGTTCFKSKLNQLKVILQMWKDGGDVQLIDEDEADIAVVSA